jgi:asparagine synthase (glutamine-hydrolysing)
MRHSLEVRSPFLDHRLFNLCAGMPERLKRRGSKGKIILRSISAGLLPSSILKYPKKGFNAPVAQWLCREWRELAEAFFTKQSILEGGLEPDAVRAMWREHLAGRRNHGFRLFTVLMYLLWKNGQDTRPRNIVRTYR